MGVGWFVCWGRRGNCSLVGHGGPGQKRQVGKWHPGAMLELRGVSRKGSEGLVRFKEARRTHIPVAMFQDVRRSAVAFFVRTRGQAFPEEIAHPEIYALFQTALKRVEEEEQVGWIHAEFMGQLIALMGLAPAHLLRPVQMCWTCNRANGSTPWAPQKITCRHRCRVVHATHGRSRPPFHR